MLKSPCAGMLSDGESLCFTDADDNRADKRWLCIPLINILFMALILSVAI
ncbi:TPA: hypothetical protein I8235_003379 [Kluyvera intermedia]|nr:hypothetical protein [Kluyvera intermedia]